MHFKDNSKELVVVVSVTNWAEYPRFRHQITRQLKKQYNVLYVEKCLGIDKKCKDELTVIDDDMIIYKCYYIDRKYQRFYNYSTILHDVFDAVCSKKIEDVVKGSGYKYAILVNFIFHFREIMKSKIYEKKIYLCNDDFVSMNRYKWQRKIFESYESDVIRMANVCIVHSRYLYDKFIKIKKDVLIIEPGHEFYFKKERYKKKCEGAKIKVCYMGYIDKRICIEWLIEILEQANMELYLIGPIQKCFSVERISMYKNINMIKPLTGEALYRKMNEMDVFIIPYDLSNPMVRACVPNKIYQYMACGKPIVMSDLPQIKGFDGDVISKVKEKKDFVNKINEVFIRDEQIKMNKRYDIAEKNTWDARGKYLLSVISGVS